MPTLSHLNNATASPATLSGYSDLQTNFKKVKKITYHLLTPISTKFCMMIEDLRAIIALL